MYLFIYFLFRLEFCCFCCDGKMKTITTTIMTAKDHGRPFIFYLLSRIAFSISTTKELGAVSKDLMAINMKR